jgi:aminocarboxymuconate-semialdehyde decarboxylase
LRIDVHNHAIPQPAVELLNRDPVYGVTIEDGVWRGGVHVNFELAPSFLDAGAKLAELESHGIDGAVVSVSPTIFYYHVDAAAGEAIAVAGNEGLAAMASDRLKWMASVPLQAPERAAAVLSEAAEAGAVGVEIGTSAGPETPLDDPSLEPFWAAASKLGLPVMLHPAYVPKHPRLQDYYLENVIGFPLETTIALERLICGGVLDRHPDLRVVGLHAGGYFPWQAGRLRHARTVRPELAESPADPWSYLGRILLDPITHDADALRYLVAKIGAENIVLGTDLPFDMATPDPLGALRAALDEETVAQISERNPAELYRFTTEGITSRV